jgi:hypothetical protein
MDDRESKMKPKPKPKLKLYRLRAPAQLHGEIKPTGYQFTMLEDQKGPHKTIVASNVGAHRGVGRFLEENPAPRDEPLYEEVKEGEPGYDQFMAEQHELEQLEAKRNYGSTL